MNSRESLLRIAFLTALAFVGLAVASGSASATTSGDVYGGSGDWVVNNPTSYDSEIVDISGIVDVYSDLTIDLSDLTFSIPDGAIIVHNGGSLTLRNSTGSTSDTSYYFRFVIEDGASHSEIWDSTLSYIDGGVFITGGDHVIGNTAIYNGLGYGVRLLDSDASLFNLVITADTVSAYSQTSSSDVEPCYTDQWGYTYCYSYYYTNKTWSARAIGVEAVRGSPSIDTLNISITDVSSTVYADLGGHYVTTLDFTVYPYLYDYAYYYEYDTAGLELYGFRGVDATFTTFTGVSPVIDNVSAEVHANLVADSCYVYEWGWSTDSYCYDYESWAYNWLDLGSVVVLVYLENAGLANIDGLDLEMGDVSISFFNDWNPSWNYYVSYWEENNVNQGASQIYGLYSVERVTISAPQAVTPTSVTISNSVIRKAGVRADRIYTYTAPVGSNTTFRGTIRIDNVQIIDSPSTGVVLYVDATSTNTYPTYDFTVEVVDSFFAGARAFLLNVANKPSISTNYTATFLIQNNTFLNGSVRAGSNFDAIMVVNTGGHQAQLAGDTYKVDFVMRDNTFENMYGPLFGFDYSNYRFKGGSRLLIENNTFKEIHEYTDSYSDALIKTTMDEVTLRGNVITNYSFVYGFLGGEFGDDSDWIWSYYFIDPYYCQMYYPCARSWPFKTPTITIEGNTIDNAEMVTSSQWSVAWINIPGRGRVVFNNNTVTNSQALWVNVMLQYYDYYRFPTEDIDVRIEGNFIQGHSDFPFARYMDPYKSGQAVRMLNNVFRDSDERFFDWSPVSPWYVPSDWRATMALDGNSFFNITGDAVSLTGRASVINNTWDGISGWALEMEGMTTVPPLSSNTVVNSTNGYNLRPVVLSGIVSTSTFSNLIIRVTATGIRMQDGNMIILNSDFGDAAIAVEVHDGYAEVYSSAIRILSGRVQGDASIDVFNLVGYSVHWGNAQGADSGVPVKDALVVMFTADNRLAGSGYTDQAGLVAPRLIEIWKMVAFGSLTASDVYVPFNVIATKSGISQTFSVPQVPPGASIEFFDDVLAYPVVLIDYIVPTISIGSPLPGETVGSTTVEISGYTFERGSGVTLQRVRIDNGPWIDIPRGSATWKVTVPGVGEGAHTIYAQVEDLATNTYATSVEFFVDVTPPDLTLLKPLEVDTLTNQPVFDIQGHVEPADSEVWINGVPAAVTGRGDFFYNYSLADGFNVLRFTATDRARNQVVIVRTISFDRYPPFLQVDTPVNGVLLNRNTVDVLGRTERDARVTVNGLLADVNPINGGFSLPSVKLDDLFDQTENLLVIRAVDAAGNVRFENRTVIVDTKAPAINLELDDAVRANITAGRPVAVNQLNVKGSTDSSDAIISIGGQAVPLSGFSFSRLIVLREGLNHIQITAEDKAGNQREATLRVVRDTVRPVLVLETPSEPSLLTNQSTLLVTGYTDTPGSLVSIVYTNVRGVRTIDQVPTVPVGLPVQHRFEYTLVLNTDGNEHVVEVRATDLAGNFDSKTFDYTAKVGKPFLEIVGFKTYTKDTFVWINGTTEPGIQRVTINGQEFDVVDRVFTVRWNLPITHGNYTFTVSVRDAAGNANVYANRTLVDVPQPDLAVRQGTSLLEEPWFQVGIGAGLLGLAIAVFGVAVTSARRREL